MLTLLAMTSALAGTDAELTWDLSVKGTPMGTQTTKVRVITGSDGSRRVIESYTEMAGQAGGVTVQFKQRLTANVVANDPASFHSVVEEGGVRSEIQGRFSPAGWVVTSNVAGRSRTVEYPVTKVDLSTADLFDPESRLRMDGTTRMLATTSGQVLTGPVESRGANERTVGGTKVAVTRKAWTSPEGTTVLDFSGEGYLVGFSMPIAGVMVDGQLTGPPPGGVDDFPVSVRRPEVEVLTL